MSNPIHPDQLDSTRKFTFFGAELQGEKLTGLGTPTLTDDGTTKDYVDTLVGATINGFDFKAAVETSTEGVGNIVLFGEQTLNGYLTSGSRVGVVEQTLPAENCIYITGPGAWTRALDADEDAEVTNGLTFFVGDTGSSVAGQQYLLITPDPIVVGVTALTFQVIPRLTLATVAPANVDKSAAVIGTSTRAAHEDHKHDISTAAPAATGVAAASGEGVATSLARSDHTHQSNTAPANVTKAAAVIGVSGEPARADHKHDVSTAAPGTTTFGAAAEGVSTSLARADHAHALTAPGNPTNITATAALDPGVSANVARQDHAHSISTADPGSVKIGDGTLTGVSASLARADHQHSVLGGTPIEITDSTNADGASTAFARANHQHSHGVRGGGTLHAAATGATAGFMSAADKDKLDKSSNIVTLVEGTDSVNGATFTAAGGVVINFATLSLAPAEFIVRWDQVAVPTNNAEVRLQDITGGVTLGSALAIASTGLKSFALTVLPAGVAYVELQHREAVAGAGTSDIRGATLTIET